ncbi:MAG: 1-acyl-sn-glycerol-3-phosphate acyltransferase [Solirubrobacterales bacterium]|nr:1-acyl-sn-glycerol-3-phosphate acyltransferase [Solirubrobacterales bacterium]
MAYRLFTILLTPLAWWGRLRVAGIASVPKQGALLVVPNHDSQMDPILIALALRRHRPLRFLARADLWRNRPLGWLLYGINQIPIERGTGDTAALDEAIATLREGKAICIFPEGKLSRGEALRARTGVSRLAAACPEARVVLCTVTGSTDFVRFPRRPRCAVEFLATAALPSPADEPREFAATLLGDLRLRVPPQAAGRAVRV